MWPADSSPAGRVAVRRRPVREVLMTADAVGGVWRYAVDLGAALAHRGVRLSLAVMGPAPDDAQLREAQARGLAVRHRPYRLEWMEQPWDDVRRAGSWLLALERRLRPDVVHLNGYAHAALPWSAPAVVVAHSCVRSWWRAVKAEDAPGCLEQYREAVAAGLTAARLVVAPTQAMLDALDAEYGLRLQGRVVPNGLAASTRLTPLMLQDKEPLVLAAGRAWDEAKNLAALCDVAPALEWPVSVAGDDRDPDGRTRELPCVRRLGRLGPVEMAAWYRRAAVYALPAKYEPFGLSVLEAAAAGCALVLGDIASLRENWTGAAVFVPPDDRQALASALERLIARPAERRALGRRAHARAAALTIGRTADEYLRLYEDLVE